ncbi:MAG: hypothetical protein K8S97_15535 [Anaerolineae bacterium]|nr:hypothetical protein [Anaerolineae bacterium]
MPANHPLSHVPRRALNSTAIVGGIVGLVLQSRFGWDVLTTFLITLTLCALSVGIVAAAYHIRRQE